MNSAHAPTPGRATRRAGPKLIAILAVLPLTTGACRCAGPEIPCKTEAQGTGVEEEVCIPGGSYWMGHDKLPKPPIDPNTPYNPMPINDWAPEHEVTLSPFFMDKYEVTWGRYLKCVQAGVCSTQHIDIYPSTRQALTEPSMQNRPVEAISYAEAVTFCQWDGKRLPTEAEWERAARGTRESDYPWGNSLPSKALLASRNDYVTDANQFDQDPPDVGTNTEDVSEEGVHDLFASVQEWVADWYDPFYYAQSPRTDPTGPTGPVYVSKPNDYGAGNTVDAAGERVVRGQMWNTSGENAWDLDNRGAPVWFRAKLDPGTVAGIRCARDDRPSHQSPPSGFWRYPKLQWYSLATRGTR